MAESSNLVNLCPICAEVVTGVATKARTQCCLELVCHECAVNLGSDQPDRVDQPDHFTCPNCHGDTTVIVPATVAKALTDFYLYFREGFNDTTMAAQHRLEQLLEQRSHFDQLESDLADNMAKLMLDPTTNQEVVTNIADYQRAYIKTINLARADHRQLIQRAEAEINYLNQLCQRVEQLNQVAKLESSNHADADATAPATALTLIQLSHELSTFQSRFWNDFPPKLLQYQPMLIFNNYLIPDDINQQFNNWLDRDYQPKRVILPGLEARLRQIRPLMYERAFLVDSGTDYLICFCYRTGNGYALVDSSGQILYHHLYDTLLAINATWLVSLETKADGSNVKVARLVDVLGKNTAEIPATIPVENNRVFACLDHYSDHLSLWSEKNPVGNQWLPKFTNWALAVTQRQLHNTFTVTATLQHEYSSQANQRIQAYHNGNVIVTQQGQLHCTCVDKEGILYKTELIERETSWRMLPNGWVVFSSPRDNRLWRPDGLKSLPYNGIARQRSLDSLSSSCQGRLIDIAGRDDDTEIDFY